MNYKMGITGNYYYTSVTREPLIAICNAIGKSVNSIYYNKKYKLYVVRIKSKHHKLKAKQLHIDHINGICNDNRLENLRFLCPNCHSQTDTYSGKNKPQR